ncbi:MAG: TonB-dependent receptor [Candidatus Kapaibacterium sp.]|nr:MAG: TonB-dependent receptor [Candidatus Kapabacteria bacterium]
MNGIALILWILVIVSSGIMLCASTVHDSTARMYHSKELVVTATRSPIERSATPTLVTTLSSTLLRQLGEPSLGTVLCYAPAARVEVNCQTCNYSQVRLNGLAGSYTQLLINGRPIISPLVALYGLDQFPTAMLDRIEVLRGSASVLYGSSAIAGVVNLITREQWHSSASVNSTLSLIGGTALENMSSATLLLGDDDERIPSLAVIAHRRTRDGYDANSDGFTELAQLRTTGIGVETRMGTDTVGAFHASIVLLGEERRGGNRLDLPPDRADQAEYRNHDITFFTTDYAYRLGKHRLDGYAALTTTTRIHYTGVDHADGWGRTQSTSGIVGIQDAIAFDSQFLEQIQIGAEYQFERTTDAIESYGYAIDQRIRQKSLFAQAIVGWVPEWTALVGLRTTWHSALDRPVVLTRLGMLWKPSSWWDVRFNYGEGFRAPQAFETDMHIAFASGGVSLIRIDPALQQESARSITLSISGRISNDDLACEASVDGFATWLRGTFVLADAGMDTNGNRTLLRTNGSNAQVTGITAEVYALWQGFEMTASATIQQSWFDEPVRWSLRMAPESRFLRTPNVYGSVTLRAQLSDRWEALATGIMTGSMLVPHLGVVADELVHTPLMFDCSLTIRWQLTERSSGIGALSLGAKVSNLFDAYQRDFDRGRYRDSNYVWGPPQPRTVAVEVQWSR